MPTVTKVDAKIELIREKIKTDIRRVESEMQNIRANRREAKSDPFTITADGLDINGRQHYLQGLRYALSVISDVEQRVR